MLWSALNLSGQETSYSATQMKSDLLFLKKQLENRHPNLYTYHSKVKIDAYFDSLSNGLTSPLTESAFYKHITTLSSVINDGHTIFLPSKSFTSFHNQNSQFLPFHFTILEDKLYVDKVCTADPGIPNGAEILSINNVMSSDIIEQLTIRQIRDGYNSTYPRWILNNYFREYYSYIFGHPGQFVISYKSGTITKTATLRALSKDSIYYYQDLKYPERNNLPKVNEGITLRISKDSNFAALKIKDFHNNILRKEYRQNFKKTITRFFEELQQSGVEHLILDLRDNQGGDIPNGALLVSYLLDTPFSIVQAYYQVGKDGLRKSKGQSLGTFQPKTKSFKGALYVLINGGSFSNSGIVVSCLKRNNRGIFIGEETGGNNKILAGYVKNISLPNTKIQVQIPTRQFLLDSHLVLTGHGTTPDIPVQNSIEQLINNTDTIMNQTLELIRQTEQKKSN